MNLTGKISDKKETLVGANIYVSDKNGQILLPSNGTSTDIVGDYTLRGLNPSDYVTASFVGYSDITKKVSQLGSGSTVTHDFVLQPKSSQLGEFEVVAEREKILSSKRNSSYKPLVYVGLGLAAVGLGYLAYKKYKT